MSDYEPRIGDKVKIKVGSRYGQDFGFGWVWERAEKDVEFMVREKSWPDYFLIVAP